MKKLISIFSFLWVLTSPINAQIFDPVDWSTTVEKVSENEFDLVITATIESGWHVYSQNIGDDGPIPTSFRFEESEKEYQIIGKTTEGVGHEGFDKVFEMDIKYFENNAIFKQRVNLFFIYPLS